jgi:hypothetical protein
MNAKRGCAEQPKANRRPPVSSEQKSTSERTNGPHDRRVPSMWVAGTIQDYGCRQGCRGTNPRDRILNESSLASPNPEWFLRLLHFAISRGTNNGVSRYKES